MAHNDVTTCCPGLGSGYLAIFRKYPLKNNNQQSNLPLKKAERFEIGTLIQLTLEYILFFYLFFTKSATLRKHFRISENLVRSRRYQCKRILVIAKLLFPIIDNLLFRGDCKIVYPVTCLTKNSKGSITSITILVFVVNKVLLTGVV